MKATWRVLETMGLNSLASDSDVSILRYLASAVSIRAAQIVGACKSLTFYTRIVFSELISAMEMRTNYINNNIII